MPGTARDGAWSGVAGLFQRGDLVLRGGERPHSPGRPRLTRTSCSDVKLFAVTEIADLARLGRVDLKTLAGLALGPVSRWVAPVAEDADRLVARAIESVLDQVPGTHDTTVPDALPPFNSCSRGRRTAAPGGRNKRLFEGPRS